MDHQALNALNVSLSTLSINIQEDGIAIVKLDIPNAKENSFTQEVSKDFEKVTNFIQNNDFIKAVIIMSGKFNSYIAGADIKLLDTFKDEEEAEKYVRNGQLFLQQLEKSEKPVISAIMGTCMGGGLELALACKYRIAVNDRKTVFALPEVMLGLIPGAGGTQRLPQLISITNALDMVLTGKSIKPEKAISIGLIDELIEPLESDAASHYKLEIAAIERAKQILNGTFAIQRSRPFTERITNFFLCRWPFLDTIVLRTAKNKILEETKGNYPAPLKILEAIRIGLIEGNEKGYEFEAKSFAQLSQSPEAAALIGIFNASTDCKKYKYGDAKKIEKIGIVGAGVSGIGIAKISIDKGIKIILVDISNESLENAQKEITAYLDLGLQRKRYTKPEYDEYLSSLTLTTSFSQLQDVDLVFEAVGKNLCCTILLEIESNVSEDCVIAVTTFRFLLENLIAGCSTRSRMIGMHYSIPIEKTQIIEIISTDSTSKETIATAAKLGLVQKKLIIPEKNFSFLNRCLLPMVSEVVRLLLEGHTPEEIDELTKSAGFHVGCVTLIDAIGIDLITVASNHLAYDMGKRGMNESIRILEEMQKAGFYGKKNNLGFYDYSNPQSPQINNDAIQILKTYPLKPKPTCSSLDDCKMRILSRFVNEACYCLNEGIIASSANGDIASVFGLGFPPFKGGPFRFIDSYGAENLIKDLKRFGKAYSKEEFAPSKILLDYAKVGKLFYQKQKHIANNKL